MCHPFGRQRFLLGLLLIYSQGVTLEVLESRRMEEKVPRNVLKGCKPAALASVKLLIWAKLSNLVHIFHYLCTK